MTALDDASEDVDEAIFQIGEMLDALGAEKKGLVVEWLNEDREYVSRGTFEASVAQSNALLKVIESVPTDALDIALLSLGPNDGTAARAIKNEKIRRRLA